MRWIRTAALCSTLTVTAGLLAAAGASAAPDRAARPDPELSYHGTTRLVVVHARTPAERSEVVQLGLDATSRVTRRGLEVILHGPRDARLLREAGFTWTTKVDDLAAHARADARADRRYAQRVARSPLPSGRTTYRRLGDFNAEMRALHQRFPRLTEPLTLPRPSVLGRRVHGIEITTDAANREDGKPVFLLLGAHHAREWPTGEHAIEYAYDLLKNYRRADGDPRADRIMRRTRTIVVPIVNPDGFAISRNAEPLGDFSVFDYEMKRKNCDVSVHTPRKYRRGTCADNPAGRYRGTDLNRNYPGFWGGPGASPVWSDDTYRGDGPGSEPEVANIRRLISQRQVVSLITLHTYGNLLLRPPSLLDTGRPPDEPVYARLGDRLAAANHYASQAGFQLYDTSGSTEDWSYWNTGGFAFTFEIGTRGFHPRYRPGVVAEYLGRAPAAGAGHGGNREALYRMSMATLDADLHSTITGTAPARHRLTLYKRFVSATSPVLDAEGDPGAPLYYQDVLRSDYHSDGGRFAWSVNPSTRPVIVGRYGRDPLAPPQEDVDLVNPPGIPAEGETEEATFTVEGLPEADNAIAQVVIGWGGDDPDVDWDVVVVDDQGVPVAAAETLDNPETALLVDPAPGEYTVQVTNYAGGTAASDWTGYVTFDGPQPATYSGLHEAWLLTCTDLRSGRVVGSREVVVDRGETARAGRVCTPAAGKGGPR
jgi:hypothetical protein